MPTQGASITVQGGLDLVSSSHALFRTPGAATRLQNFESATTGGYRRISAQPSLQDSDNFRWRGDISLEFPVWDFLNFKINYYRTYESVVVEPQLQEDEFLTFGFTIKNYK